MLKYGRLMVTAAVAALAIAGAMGIRPAAAQLDPGPSLKGKWKGTFQSTRGNGSGSVSFKITKDKVQGGAARQLKGTGKFGPSGKRSIVGTSSSTTLLISFLASRNNTDTYGLSGRVSDDGKTITGNYTVLTAAQQQKDAGTVTLTK